MVSRKSRGTSCKMIRCIERDKAGESSGGKQKKKNVSFLRQKKNGEENLTKNKGKFCKFIVIKIRLLDNNTMRDEKEKKEETRKNKDYKPKERQLLGTEM